MGVTSEMVSKKDFVEILMPKEMIEEAKEHAIEGALRARPMYESKTTEELEEIVRAQIWYHLYCAVGKNSDDELNACESILVEDRGYSWEDIDKLWYQVMMENRRNGMEYQVFYVGTPGGGEESVDYTKPIVEIRSKHGYMRLSGNELAECYL